MSVGNVQTGRMQGENDATRILRLRGSSQSISGGSSRGGSGGAGGAPAGLPSGGGGAPVTGSPWKEALLAVAASGSDTLDFGATAGIVAATCLVYMERASALTCVGWLEIWADGSGTAQIVADLFGDDCSITFSVDASSGDLILTATDSGGTGATTLDVAYLLEGANIAVAWGTYHAVRGSLVERGRFSIQVNGTNVSISRRGRGDDCGLAFTGTISAGILQFTVAADNSDTNSTAIGFTPDQASTDAAWQWERQSLAVLHNTSAPTTLQMTIGGALDWQSTVITIPASTTADPLVFLAGDGCEHIFYAAFRGSTLWENGFIHLWNDLATGAFSPTVWDGGPSTLGLTLSGVFSGGNLILTAGADGTDGNDTRLLLRWLPRPQL